MMRSWVFAVSLIATAAGCGGSKPAPDVNPDDAGRALRSAMDGWKAGKTRPDLQAANPSIVFNEDDCGSDKQLVEYVMDEAGSLDGRQVRWVVQLKLKDPAGKVSSKKATYIIDTIPRIVIVRDQFAS